MKKFLASLVLGLMCLAAVKAIAAATPKQETGTITAGTGAVTNSADYYVLKVEAVELFAVTPAISTATVVRVGSGLTNTVATITTAGGVGRYEETNTTYLFKGDVLRVSGGGTNTGTLRVVGQLLP